MKSQSIPGSHDITSNVPSHLAELVLRSQTADPVDVLREYQAVFLTGRPLDISEESVTIEGDTSALFVSRLDIFADSMEEIEHLENIRNPLEVNFHGENAEDYGGPRKEFFNLMMVEIQERLVSVANGSITLKIEDELIARRHCYYAGLIIGLSALQGGPLAEFLDQLLQSPETEHKAQFVRGLEKSGLLKLMRGKSVMKFLFRRHERSKLTVQKFVKTFEVHFSEEGSSRRIQEENVYRNFLRYLRDVYAGRRGNVTLEHILTFVTCTKTVPVLGYAIPPSIVFQLDDDARFPTATTCINRLTLPRETSFDLYDMAFLNTHFGLN